MSENTNNVSFPSPFAKYSGILELGDKKVECYVLDTGKRVISLGGTVKALTDTIHSNLAQYIKVKALQPYINKDLVYDQSIGFYIHGASGPGRGLTTKVFLEICRAYVNALAAGSLTTDKQKDIALRCGIMLSACAEIGLDALIDEATGYQYEREPDALQIKLKAFFSEELREWEKTFPDELWEEFGRLTNWQGALHSRPKWWGMLVMELIYEALDHDVAEHLKTHKPPPKHGLNYHQWLSKDLGLKALVTHINQVIGIAKTCDTIHELKEKVAHFYKGGAIQQKLFKKNYNS